MCPVLQRDRSQGLGCSEQGLNTEVTSEAAEEDHMGSSHIGELSSGVDKRGREEGTRGRTLKLGRVCGLEWSREQCPV